MTQHILHEIVFDALLFDPAHCVHEEYADFRGLTCCQAGKWLQLSWQEQLPAVLGAVRYLAELPEPLPERVARAVNQLRYFLESEFRMTGTARGNTTDACPVEAPKDARDGTAF